MGWLGEVSNVQWFIIFLLFVSGYWQDKYNKQSAAREQRIIDILEEMKPDGSAWYDE